MLQKQIIPCEIASRGTMLFIVVKAARMLDEMLDRPRFRPSFHQHCEFGESQNVAEMVAQL